MTISVGARLGAYEITALIGEGGMGRVFRARDTTLHRDVALKVLPDSWSRDPDRLARLEREARLLAALNHPNIAGIHHLEQTGGASVLVMEFVPGPTLAERIGGTTYVGRVLSDPPRLPGPKGPGLPIEEALAIALQIAHALEAAHAKGIVHRDLKPANIKITPEGQVKLLDFGLAKAFDDEPGTGVARGGLATPVPGSITHSPTVLGGPTMAGVILGTAAYMSPEQARGQRVDAQTDVWAFGCVLYEMLTRRRAFTGATVTDILAAVVRGEPDWTALPPDTPIVVRSLLRRCLQKDPVRRLHHIADVRIDIEDAKDEPQAPDAVRAKPRRTERWAWIAVAVLSLGAATLSAIVLFGLRPAPAPPEMRLEITTPPSPDRFALALSPDGQKVVFVAISDGRRRLWLRQLSTAVAQPMPGTDGATYPFWSPDSQSIGFFSDGKLKRIAVGGGATQAIADAPDGRGGAWSRDNVIIFTPAPGAVVFRVPANGGQPQAVTRVEVDQNSNRFPQFLPDGRHFLYYGQGSAGHRGAYVASLDTADAVRLFESDTPAVFAAPGHLLFGRQGTLVAQAFDPDRRVVSGEPFPVAEQVLTDSTVNFTAVSASAVHSFVYRPGNAGERELQWFDRSGKHVGNVGVADAASPMNPELSPDGRRVALDRTVNGNRDIWLIEATRGTPTRLTFNDATDFFPSWSPDGSRVFFISLRGDVGIYHSQSGGTGTEELLVTSPQSKVLQDVSPDGRMLIVRVLQPKTGWDLVALPVDGRSSQVPVAQTPFDEREGQFSPDGKWIAYASNESGRFEVYAQAFPTAGAKWQLSTRGGSQPRWRHDGRELFYIDVDGKLMSVPLAPTAPGQAFEAAAATELFQTRIFDGTVTPSSNRHQYAVSPDGTRFLINTEIQESAPSPIIMVLNWKPPGK